MPHFRGEKTAELLPDIQLQEHQQRIADRVSGDDPRLLVYHGLGSGKSLSAIAAAEAAKKLYGDNYGVVVPASLKGNFQKEIQKFTQKSDPEIMSYTGLGMGKHFKHQPDTLIMDEAARLRNPDAAMTRAALQNAGRAKRLMLLTGTPITNEPKDLASLISIIRNEKYDPEQFDKDFVGEKRVWPGFWGFLHGARAGVKPVMKNGPKLRELLKGHVDYQPSKTPEGVDVNEETVNVPLSKEQQRIQKALRTQIPPGFLWKLDREFPLSREELAKLNSFMTGLRQVSLSTQPFRADKDPLKAFGQSSKLQEAFKRLRTTLDEDPRKKAIIYSNFVDAGLGPYAAGLAANNVPYGIFHGGIASKARQEALKNYNEGKLRALLIGPAGAEGISTKGTSLIQLLDPYWNESRLQQAQGRGLRFDSHAGLPEELKNVAVQRFLSSSDEPGLLGKLLGKHRQRTGDEVIQHMADEKEKLNEQFRQLLREVGTEKSEKTSAYMFGEKLAEMPTVKPLGHAQHFPAPQPAVVAQTGKTPLYQHPSGSLQLGNLRYWDKTQQQPGTPAPPVPGIAAQPESPGVDSGAGVFRISQHGGGTGQPNPSEFFYSDRLGTYGLSNPNNEPLSIAERGNALNPAQPPSALPATQKLHRTDPGVTYEQEITRNRAWNDKIDAARNAVRHGPAVPPNFNPQTVISNSCNSDPRGCTPATYARWLNAERGINSGYADQMAKLPSTLQFDEQWADKQRAADKEYAAAADKYNDRSLYQKLFGPKVNEPQPPTAPRPDVPTLPKAPEMSPLALNKVVMTPPGYLGRGTYAGNPFSHGSFATPYLTESGAWDKKDSKSAPPHEYRLTRGGDPMNDNHWTDTGVYTDARQSLLPLVGVHGEAKEFGRHLGLGPELGGGGLGSYLDKVRAINNNPDATYGQKVYGNFARPVGSALQFGRELGGLGYDTARLGGRYLRSLW